MEDLRLRTFGADSAQGLLRKCGAFAGPRFVTLKVLLIPSGQYDGLRTRGWTARQPQLRTVRCAGGDEVFLASELTARKNSVRRYVLEDAVTQRQEIF